ncbi:MAG: hypothetical protein ABII79_05465, partial [bacterium]
DPLRGAMPPSNPPFGVKIAGLKTDLPYVTVIPPVNAVCDRLAAPPLLQRHNLDCIQGAV